MAAAATATSLEKASLADVPAQLDVTPNAGLTASEAKARLARYGPNALPEKHVSPWRKVLGYLTGPIAFMIEAAAIVSAILGHWDDFAIIASLLVFNAALGFWQDSKAANALAALKAGLAPTAMVLRDGSWQTADAATLVPGDIVRVRLGNIVPADLRFMGEGFASIDQSALTGESVPVTKHGGDPAYSGSTVKQGEMTGVVIATGSSTFFRQDGEARCRCRRGQPRATGDVPDRELSDRGRSGTQWSSWSSAKPGARSIPVDGAGATHWQSCNSFWFCWWLPSRWPCRRSSR